MNYTVKKDYSKEVKTNYQIIRRNFTSQKRPNLEMFNDHITSVINENNLDYCHINARALSLSQEENRWMVTGHQATYDSSHVIIATGINHLHHIPHFLTAVSPDYDVVIGGGVTNDNLMTDSYMAEQTETNL